MLDVDDDAEYDVCVTKPLPDGLLDSANSSVDIGFKPGFGS